MRAQEAISGQIRAEQDGLRNKLAAYADDARNYRLTEDEKLQASREAIEQTYAAELDLMNRKRDLAQTSLGDRQRIDNHIAALERNEQRQLAQLTRESLDEQARNYVTFGYTVAGAFNSQLRGLLSGTETWRDAFKNTLAELLIDFIEFERTHGRAMGSRRGHQDRRHRHRNRLSSCPPASRRFCVSG